MHGLRVEGQELYLVDAQRLGCQLHLLALACQLVGTVAADIACRILRWHLLDFANELSEHLLYQLTGDMACRVGHVHGVLTVVAGRRGTQLQRGCVFLRGLLQLFDALCGLSGTENQYARGQGVEGAGMTRLQTLHMECLRQTGAHVCQRTE